MGEDLKRLINVREAYCGHCTGAVKTANEIMESYSPDLDALKDVFEGLCSRMERLSLQNQKIELAVADRPFSIMQAFFRYFLGKRAFFFVFS